MREEEGFPSKSAWPEHTPRKVHDPDEIKGVHRVYIWNPDKNPKITEKNLASFLLQTLEHRIPVPSDKYPTRGWVRRWNDLDEEIDDIQQFIRENADAFTAGKLTQTGTTSELLRAIDPSTPKHLVQKLKDALTTPRYTREAEAQGRAMMRSEHSNAMAAPRHTWTYRDAQNQTRTRSSTPPPGSYRPTAEDYKFADLKIQSQQEGPPLEITAYVQRGRAPKVRVVFKDPDDKLALLGIRKREGVGVVKEIDREDMLKTLGNRLRLTGAALESAVTRYRQYIQKMASAAPRNKNATISPMSFVEFLQQKKK